MSGSQASPRRVPHARASGFEALREMLAVLPLSFLWAPLLGLPGVRRLGGMAYRAAAGRQTRVLQASASR